MGTVGFNSQEAVQAMTDAIKNNETLTEKFDEVSKSIDEAFADGGIVGGAVGTASANDWGSNAYGYFKTLLLTETERFLFDKVQPIIGLNNEYTTDTQDVYSTAKKSEESE